MLLSLFFLISMFGQKGGGGEEDYALENKIENELYFRDKKEIILS